MLVGWTGRLDDAVMPRHNADANVVGPAPQGILGAKTSWRRGRWLLFDGANFAFSLGAFGGAGRGDFARLHELADVAVHGKETDGRDADGEGGDNLRLEELVSSLELLVLRLDNFDAVDNL